MKRKASSELTPDGIEERSIASCVTRIDAKGDLQLNFTKDLPEAFGLLVNKRALCSSSPVFNAMIGDNSRFLEATNKVLNEDGAQVILLEDDDFTTMEILMNILHFRTNCIPNEVAIDQLVLLAKHCDKYDFAHIAGAWPDRWTAQHADDVASHEYERLMFVAAVFQLPEVYEKVTRVIIMNSRLTNAGDLEIDTLPDWSEGVASKALGETARAAPTSHSTY